jgi:hypothetical protein
VTAKNGFWHGGLSFLCGILDDFSLELLLSSYLYDLKCKIIISV